MYLKYKWSSRSQHKKLRRFLKSKYSKNLHIASFLEEMKDTQDHISQTLFQTMKVIHDYHMTPLSHSSLQDLLLAHLGFYLYRKKSTLKNAGTGVFIKRIF